MKIKDMDLQQESIKFSAAYLKKTQQEGLGLADKSKISTTAAHGFFAGVRWKEEQDELNKSGEGGSIGEHTSV